MKRIIACILSLIIILSFIGCSENEISEKKISPIKFAQAGEENPSKDFEYKLNTTQIFSGDIDIYKLVDRKLDKQGFKNLLQKFIPNSSDERISYDNTSHIFNYKDNSKYVISEESGRFSYGTTKPVNLDKKGKIQLLSDIDAKKVAIDYLKKLDLLPKDFFVSSVNEGLVTEYSDGTRDVENKQVVFHRKVNGKEVLGVSRIQVDVGENGKIERVGSYYRDYEAYTKKKLKDVKTALDELKNNKGLETFEGGIQPKKCIINKIALCYFEEPSNVEQPYLYPVYEMTGITTDENGKSNNYTGIVQAFD